MTLTTYAPVLRRRLLPAGFQRLLGGLRVGTVLAVTAARSA